jgi:hypothetical protein
MRANNHLPQEDYLEDAEVGTELLEAMTERAEDCLGREDVAVTFFWEKGAGANDESRTCGYEIREVDLKSGEEFRKHLRIDDGYETILDAIAGFIEWCERHEDDDDED